MKSTAEYLILLKQFKDTKAKSYGISKIGLFGSVARGDDGKDSDIDILIVSDYWEKLIRLLLM